VSLDVSLALAPRIPQSVIKVSESGVFGSKDVQRLMDAGFDAFLVGEHLMKSQDAARAIQDLVVA
jgi:indole-3-glycerol phosphate synthase